MASGGSISSMKTKMSKLAEPNIVETGGKTFARRRLTIIVRWSVTFHFFIPRLCQLAMEETAPSTGCWFKTCSVAWRTLHKTAGTVTESLKDHFIILTVPLIQVMEDMVKTNAFHEHNLIAAALSVAAGQVQFAWVIITAYTHSLKSTYSCFGSSILSRKGNSKSRVRIYSEKECHPFHDGNHPT